ncbi:GNAT family N-acetyltransferase [uncultured Polaribacter sp.]|uniref:GNAT family N-acetyltransferase n=1 Tax=uncultured Polaribacter sp. TaxID=174711 RepID=UPI0026147320|nr:GNAT family N-acetyltransferase [uncultured Polaribacter sp.]
MISVAKIKDANKLTEIALKSKVYWGYSNHLIESWQEDLTITSVMISESYIFKFLVDDTIVGFYFLNPLIEKSIELEMLFVLPAFIGKGIGKQLLIHAFQKARTLKASTMTLLADPNAVPFYNSQGFYTIDNKESSIIGRFLPVMQKDLEE